MTLKVLPSYFTALFSCLLLALEGKFPALSKRRGFAAWGAFIVILVCIAAAVVVFFIIVTIPSTTTTTTTSVYP